MRTQLVELVGHRRRHHGGIDIPAGELGPVFEKPLGQCIAPLGESDADGGEEHGLLRPPGKRVGCAVAGGIKARSGVAALELAHDQLAIAINVRADLHHRRLAITSGQRRQVGFWHDDRDLDRSPGQALEAKTEPNLFRIRGGVVVVQDDVGHGKNPSLFLFIFCNASAFR
jgi:hypothetical protein